MVTTLVLQDKPQDTFSHIFINSLGLYLCPECLLNFFSNFYIPPYVGKIFKFMEHTFLENAMIRGIFAHAPPSPLQTCFQVLIITPYRQKGITHSTRQHSFENLFSPTVERGGGNYDLLNQVFYILCNLQIFQMWWLYSFLNNIYIVWY